MSYLFKLSQGVARLRSRNLIIAAAVVALAAGCESRDVSLNGPTHPSFATSSGAPAAVLDLTGTPISDTSVTPSFTEEDDGTGAPASYDNPVLPSHISGRHVA